MESLILLNTMENYPDGMTYYDLQQFGNIPHSKIYRIMKKMEQEGYLRKEEIVEIGRPKHLYFTTEKGLKYKESIRQEVRRYLKFARIRQLQPDFDYENKILRATLEVWSSPVEYILNKDISDEEKLEILCSMENDLEEILKKIKKNKQKLKCSIENGEKNL